MLQQSQHSAKLMVPVERIELPTFGLQNRCSTAELNRQTLHRRRQIPDLSGKGYSPNLPKACAKPPTRC